MDSSTPASASGQPIASGGDLYNLPGMRAVMDVKVPMRDGVELSANIFLPPGSGPFPVILIRTPYDNGPWAETGWPGTRYRDFVGHGYAYAIQDVRGRFDSEGTFHPMMLGGNEVADGYDTRQWIAQQSWCDGKIGLVGPSYMGQVQWQGVQESSDYLTAMMPAVASIDAWRMGNVYVNGAYQLALMQPWGLMTSSRANQPVDHYNWAELFRHLPLIDMDKVATGREVPHIRQWLQHSSYSHWQGQRVEFDRVDVPIYNLAGWFDAYPASALRAFSAMRNQSRSERSRNGQKILVGPWPHDLSTSTRVGELDFGPDSLVDLSELTIRWNDYWLKGIDNGIMDEPPVRIFVMGANVWRYENEWPLARTVYTKFYLHSGGSANTLDGDGTLSREPSHYDEGPDRYAYDPANPVPTRGGNLSYTIPGVGESDELAGPFDQRPNERRDDVLVYTTAPLSHELEVTGPLHCELYISSSAPDTDFVVKLIDVHRDGAAYNFAEGILRVRYRDESWTAPQHMETGVIYQIGIEMFPTSLVFGKGHRIRLDVTSSNFPHFDRNLNTGNDPASDTEVRVAHQVVYHTADYPSHILLPVIPA
jgi:hypothetical protein